MMDTNTFSIDRHPEVTGLQRIQPGQSYLDALGGLTETSPVISHLSARLNVDVTRAGLSLSCRALLSALLDKLRVSPAGWGSLTTTFSTEECFDILGMSKSARCDARRGLISSGFVLVNGRTFDLSPWAMKVMGELPITSHFSSQKLTRPEFGKGPEFGLLSPCNVSLLNNNTLETNARIRPNFDLSSEMEVEAGALDPEAARLELYEAIQLSDRLSGSLQNALGDRLDRLDAHSLTVACGSVIGRVMPGLMRGREVWAQAVAARGSDAVLGLVAALEDTSVRSAEAWFSAFARGFGGFSSFDDIRPNLHAIRCRREKAITDAKAAEAVEQSLIERKAREDAVKSAAVLIETTLDTLETEGFMDGSSMLRLECDKAIRFSTKIAGNGGIYVTNLYQNRHADRIKEIACVVSKRTGLYLNPVV